MWELPKYIRGRISFSVEEMELLIEFICCSVSSIRMADRFIQSRLTCYEVLYRNNTINDFEVDDWKDWRDVNEYFTTHKLSFERQYFKKRIW